MEVNLDVESLRALYIVRGDTIADLSRKHNELIDMLLEQSEVAQELKQPVSPGLN